MIMKCHCKKCDPENKGCWGEARNYFHIEQPQKKKENIENEREQNKELSKAA